MSVVIDQHVMSRRRALATKIEDIRREIQSDPLLRDSMLSASYAGLVKQLGRCNAALVLKVNPWKDDM